MRVKIHGFGNRAYPRSIFDQTLTNESIERRTQEAIHHALGKIYYQTITYIEDMVTAPNILESPTPTGDINIAFTANIEAKGNYLMQINLSIAELLVIMGDRIGDITLRELLESHKETTEALPAI